MYEEYENTVDPGIMYPKLMIRYLPAGLLGLLVATFLAAYMSTIAAQLNWGTSYLINDFYRRFIKKDGDEKHYVLISRISVILLIIFSLLLTRFLLSTVSGAWEFIINASAGMGGVLILRWFWWRINAWSEISAMIAPLIIYPIAVYGFGMESPITLYPTVIGTTIVWVTVTFITRPVKESTLLSFYKRTHPGGIGWKSVAEKLPDVKSDTGFFRMFINWIFGVVLVYSMLFGIGNFIFGDFGEGIIAFALSILSIIIIYLNFKKIGWEELH
jgi:Na+/proline symporter